MVLNIPALWIESINSNISMVVDTDSKECPEVSKQDTEHGKSVDISSPWSEFVNLPSIFSFDWMNSVEYVMEGVFIA